MIGNDALFFQQIEEERPMCPFLCDWRRFERVHAAEGEHVMSIDALLYNGTDSDSCSYRRWQGC